MSKAQERRNHEEEEKRQAQYRTQFYGTRDPQAMMDRQRNGSGIRMGSKTKREVSRSGSRERPNVPVYDMLQK